MVLCANANKLFLVLLSTKGLYFYKLNFKRHPINYELPRYIDSVHIGHRMGTLFKYNLHIHEIEGEKQTPSREIKPATLRSAMHQATLLVSSFRLFGALAKLLSSRAYLHVP